MSDIIIIDLNKDWTYNLPPKAPVTLIKVASLYKAANELLAELTAHGEIRVRPCDCPLFTALSDALEAIDGGVYDV